MIKYDHQLTVPRWIVKSFNHDSLVGEVTDGITVYKFHSTSFHSSPFRFPYQGEIVEVVIAACGLSAVHEK